MSDIQLTSRIQRFICIHDALPVLSRKRCQIIRLHSGESAFIQFLRTIYNVTFHLFLGRSFQHRRIKLYSIFFQKSGLKIYIFCYLRKLWNFFQTFKPRCIADCHMSAYTNHDDWNFFWQRIQFLFQRITRFVKMFLIPATAVQPGQWLSGMFFQPFMCSLQCLFNAFAVKQFDRAFNKRIMQHVVSTSPGRSRRPCRSVFSSQGIFCASSFVPIKAIFPFSIPTASATQPASSNVRIHPLKKIFSNAYFSSFAFLSS